MTSSLPSLSSPGPLNYGRLRPSLSTGLPDPGPARPAILSRQGILLALSVVVLVVASTVLAVSIARLRHHHAGPGGPPAGPTRALAQACGQTEYPALCVESMSAFPGARTAKAQRDLVPISMNVTMGMIGQALLKSRGIGNGRAMDSYDRSAHRDCLEMLEDSLDLLNRSMFAAAAASHNITVDLKSRGRGKKPFRGMEADVMTWLSAVLTNQDTCDEQVLLGSKELKSQMSATMRNISKLVSNTLAIFAAEYGGHRRRDATGEPNNHRRLLSPLSEDVLSNEGYPSWLSRGDRAMLERTSASGFHADVVVSKDGGSGTVRTITHAISKAPNHNHRRFIIYVKAGIYKEGHILLPKKKTNVWLIGDGMGQTVITGSKSVGRDKITTFDTATFAVNGDGFLARDITFANEAGPANHQAVAIRLGGDQAVLFRCEAKGYQDTLYTYAQRHFICDCVIYGTIDFIFGNAAVVFQHCTILARKPMAHQRCTITAQARSNPVETTGMSFHSCEIKASSDLEPVKSAHPTFLGRPWRVCSRVAYITSYLGDHIHPHGWMEWAPSLPLNKLYYGEFGNRGPGSWTQGRVHWPGVHPHMTRKAASQFTVDSLIDGSSWLTQTGVGFQNGF